MIMQIQPNRASCLVTAFAMVLDIPVEKIFEQLGHNGTEVIWPELPEPFCYRGFHPQELIYFAYKHKFYFLEFQPNPNLVSVYPSREHSWEMFSGEEFTYLLNKHDGVLVGIVNNCFHAVAWNKQEKLVLDPNGTTYTIDNFSIQCFFALVIND